MWKAGFSFQLSWLAIISLLSCPFRLIYILQLKRIELDELKLGRKK